MTCGIYELTFSDNSKYIGQSVNVEKRLNRHLTDLSKDCHHNKKVQKKYHELGLPLVNILEVCDKKDLSDKEIYYCNTLNKNRLLNIAEPGQVSTILNGENNGRSKHSNAEIIDIFLLLANSDISKKEISEFTTLSYSMIRQIAAGTTHKWLGGIYPEEYALMLSKVKKKFSFTVKSPTGISYTSISQRGFAKEHGLCSTMFNQLINGKRVELLGWTLDKIGA